MRNSWDDYHDAAMMADDAGQLVQAVGLYEKAYRQAESAGACDSAQHNRWHAALTLQRIGRLQEALAVLAPVLGRRPEGGIYSDELTAAAITYLRIAQDLPAGVAERREAIEFVEHRVRDGGTYSESGKIWLWYARFQALHDQGQYLAARNVLLEHYMSDNSISNEVKVTILGKVVGCSIDLDDVEGAERWIDEMADRAVEEKGFRNLRGLRVRLMLKQSRIDEAVRLAQELFDTADNQEDRRTSSHRLAQSLIAAKSFTKARGHVARCLLSGRWEERRRDRFRAFMLAARWHTAVASAGSSVSSTERERAKARSLLKRAKEVARVLDERLASTAWSKVGTDLATKLDEEDARMR